MKNRFLWITMIAMAVAFSIPAFAQGTGAKEGGQVYQEKPLRPKPAVTLIVSHDVADFSKWLPVFENHADFRMKSGCTGIDVYQASDNANSVTVVATFATAEEAVAFSTSEGLKKAMQESGVIGEPKFAMIMNHYKHYKN